MTFSDRQSEPGGDLVPEPEPVQEPEPEHPLRSLVSVNSPAAAAPSRDLAGAQLLEEMYVNSAGS